MTGTRYPLFRGAALGALAFALVLLGKATPSVHAIPHNEAILPPGQPEVTSPAGAFDWQRLVFQSRRDGNWEIYLANGDGTGAVRLTSDPASDIQPRLNRGCTRIVFSSDRSGDYEIYAMNPDGSGLVRLTTSRGDDLEPA